MRFIINFFLIVALGFVTAGILAQELSGEHIRSFHSNIQIRESGEIVVTETIEYDFGKDERHGIFRTIPLDKTNNEGKKFRMSFELIDIIDPEGNVYTYEIERNGGDVELKIGDPNKTITGLNTYIIQYSVGGALTYFSDHDELYWNINGNQWDVPIGKITAAISLPENTQVSITSEDCYTGAYGSSDTNCIGTIQESEVVFQSTSSIPASEGLSVVATFPKDIIAELHPQEVISFWDTIGGKITLVALLIVGILWYIVYPIYLPLRWYLKGRDPDSYFGKVQAAFESPKTKAGRHLTPAETGTLIDEHAGPREISALIVDLARRGYLKIIENKKNDFDLEKGKDFEQDSSLRKFEKTILRGLFSTKNKIHLKTAKLYDTVKDVQDELYKSVVKEGYFPEHPHKVRSFYTGMAVAGAMTFNFLLLLMASIFGRLMPKKTMDGVHAANHARSLKNFLTSQERQLEFQAKNQMFFEKLLPFAVAFGVEKVWAKRFADIDMKQPEWFVSSTPVRVFNAHTFTNSLNSSFSSFNSAATPTTSSTGFSSGSGGGGFSGGGGGGGGGGSW